MSNASVWLGPVIVSAIVAVAVIVMGAVVIRTWVRALKADRAVSLARAEQAKIPPILFHRQGEVIDAVIAELESHPATYSTFPGDVRDMLYAAHDKARELERGTR